MRHCLSKAGIVMIVSVICVALTGCFDLMGGKVETSGFIADQGPGPTNSAPVISGSPAPAVNVGDNYTFTPTASDPDGDRLAFSIENKPVWADFDPRSGTISGVATLGTEGSYSNIRIAVTDGAQSSELRSFSVNVTQFAPGSATLSWTPPTENTDGSPLMDLSAYRFHYGVSQDFYPNTIYIDNVGITTYVVENLVPDTYYFVMTSINSMGVESDYSGVATIVVN